MEDKSKQIKKLDLKQNAIKILINSIYGAFGNKWFYFYNPDIAQSITLQGQDLIKFSIRAVNHYFQEKWHLDTELHALLGIDQYKISKIEAEAAIYTDTDSIYVQFDSAISSIQGAEFTREEALKMCVAIDNFRLSKYFDQCFEKYGKIFNTKNRLKFKLENLSEYGIWLKKKNYAIQVAYEPNPNMELIPKEKRFLIIKGLEPVKSSYPDWARENLKKLTSFMLEIGKTLNLEEDLIPKIKKLREDFEKLSINEVAFNFKVTVYNKYVEDEETLKLKKGIPIYGRAASYYNHLLLKTGLNKKYTPIREKEKIKFYHCAPENEYGFDVFAYAPENFPTEVAPPIDKNYQFFVLIVEPINRILTAMKISSIDITLKRNVEVVKVKSKKELTDDQLFPLYVVDEDTLEYIETPQKFWKIIGNPDADISETDFPEYLATITKYGLNSVIVPKFELEKYLKQKNKKKEKLALQMEEEDDDSDDE